MQRFVEIGYRILLPFQLTLIYFKCVRPLPHLTVPRSVFDILGIWLVWYRHISRQNGSVRCHVSNSSNFDSMCTGLEYGLSIITLFPGILLCLEFRQLIGMSYVLNAQDSVTALEESTIGH